MNLMKITDITTRMNLSSRTLRYYEQVGLIQSVRPDGERYRYYDEKNIERLKQIMVLRKMQVPIKEIRQVYENNDTQALVKTFAHRVEIIDQEIGALEELKRIINDFLQSMRAHGVTHISGLPLLYEQAGKRMEIVEKHAAKSYQELSEVSERATAAPDVGIEHLPEMRVISSIRKSDGQSDPDGLWIYLHERGIQRMLPGTHSLFEYQDQDGRSVWLQRTDGSFADDSPFEVRTLDGGLFATVSLYADEDVSVCMKSLLASLNDNPYYQTDYRHDGSLRCPVLMESLLSPDRRREHFQLYLPVQLRQPDVSLYEEGVRVFDAKPADIEAANPILWQYNVPMDGFEPILEPYYRRNEAGEAEYIAYISKRLLSTRVEVTIPFRVDIEFRVDDGSARFGYGSDEGSICIYHGNDMYAVNMENKADPRLSKHALCFLQPVVGGYFSYPQLGAIEPGVYNRLTWIVGDTHFAAILNGQVRYCAQRMPYMDMDLSLQTPQCITIGSNGQGKRYFRHVAVSQLKRRDRIEMKEGSLLINTRQSNNRLPILHRLITNHYGENYWFNGAARYVMECLGKPELDYWLCAGVTGDVLAQVYAKDRFRGDGATDYLMCDVETRRFPEEVFRKLGYAATFVAEEELQKNTAMYLQTLLSYLDKGVPVIRYHYSWGVFVGYEDYGKTLLWMTADNETPEAIAADRLFDPPAGFESDIATQYGWGWAFVGDKVEDIPLSTIYRNAVQDMPMLLRTDMPGYCFGARAFRAWADEIEGGRFDGIAPEEFEDWTQYSIYVCNLATNGSCSGRFLDKALELNPDMRFLTDVCEQYKHIERMWHSDDGRDLEALGGGFNVTLTMLQDSARRGKIATVLRNMAACMDRITEILSANLPAE